MFYVAILRAFKLFGTFTHKVAKTWFGLHKTRHTTLFGIYYYVERVKIENHSYMIEITC